MTAEVVPLRRACGGCGILFRPIMPAHDLCPRCWRFEAALRSIRRARLLLGGAA